MFDTFNTKDIKVLWRCKSLTGGCHCAHVALLHTSSSCTSLSIISLTIGVIWYSWQLYMHSSDGHEQTVLRANSLQVWKRTKGVWKHVFCITWWVMILWQSTANFKPNVADVDGQNSLLKCFFKKNRNKGAVKKSKNHNYVHLCSSCQSHDVLTPILRLS